MELVHSIRLEKKFSNFKLNNYEIALSNGTCTCDDEFKISCYSYKTKKSSKKEICINTDEWKLVLGLGMERAIYSFELVDVNDRFLLINGFGFGEMGSPLLFLLNRDDDDNLFTYLRADSYDSVYL